MTGNKINDISIISKLPWLWTFDASNNSIENIDFMSVEDNSLQFLKSLKLNGNQITHVPRLAPPHLEVVNLNKNKITSVTLHSMGKLVNLSMAQNNITSISEMMDLPALKVLNLSKNDITELVRIPQLPNLEILNFKETKLEKFTDVKNLEILTSLADLNIAGTPAEEAAGDGLKKEVLILLENLKLKKFNGEEVTEDDVKEAIDLKNDRIKEEEEKRKQAELEAAEKDAE